MHKQTLAAALFVGAILGFGSAEMIRAQVPGYVTRVLMKTDLQNLPGQEAIFYASEWAIRIPAAMARPPRRTRIRLCNRRRADV